MCIRDRHSEDLIKLLADTSDTDDDSDDTDADITYQVSHEDCESWDCDYLCLKSYYEKKGLLI